MAARPGEEIRADLEREKERSEALLLNILPEGIINRMRRGETAIADQVAEATILFATSSGSPRSARL